MSTPFKVFAADSGKALIGCLSVCLSISHTRANAAAACNWLYVVLNNGGRQD